MLDKLKVAKLFLRREFLPLLFLAGFPLAYFWKFTLARDVWIGGDLFRQFYPFGLELSRALSAGRLPLWTNGLLAGFPLLAEGQVGALYPVNLVLFLLLPAQLAISYGVLFHLALAGCGMYLLARVLGLYRPGALLAGLAFSFNGFLFGHIVHPSIVATCAWLPWLLLFQNRLHGARIETRPGAWIWFCLASLGLGLQFLAGAMQIAFFNVVAFVAFGVAGIGRWRQDEELPRPAMRQIALEIIFDIALPLLLGAGLAAAQLLPTLELVSFSPRSSGVGETEFTAYSLPPAYLTQFLSPFASGAPSEWNVEYYAYFGLTTLVLAVSAPLLRRERRVAFLGLFAIAALSFALGQLNPLYPPLYRLPFLGYFRVPARYLMLFILPSVLLAGLAFEALANRLRPSGGFSKSILGVIALFSLSGVGMIVLAQSQPLDSWLKVLQVLPLLLACLMAGTLALGLTRRLERPVFRAVVLGLVLLDLLSYAHPFFASIYAGVPPSSYEKLPRSIQALDPGLANTRTFTELVSWSESSTLASSVRPYLPALRNSLYPNIGLIYGKPSAQAYTPLAYSKYTTYLSEASPAMLNLLDVGYYMIPLGTPVPALPDEPPARLHLDILNNQVDIPPTTVRAIRVASFTEQTSDLPAGAGVGNINLRFDDGSAETVPLRLGVETSDWDYDRLMTEQLMPYSRPPIAHSFPSFWPSYGKMFEGHTYLARHDFGPGESTRRLVGIDIESSLDAGRLVIEGAWLEDAAGQSISLATLSHKNNFSIAYKSDTVAVWQNQDVMPRAFVVHGAELADDRSAFARLEAIDFPAGRLVLLADGRAVEETNDPRAQTDQVRIVDDEPERITLEVAVGRPGYLVLADSWYPGWSATVDGNPAPIYRADVILRAVPMTPGQHMVSFVYRPLSFWAGVVVSLVTLIVMAGIALAVRKNRIPK